MRKSGILFVVLLITIFVFKISADDQAEIKKDTKELASLNKAADIVNN